jgi:hypothetical protein
MGMFLKIERTIGDLLQFVSQPLRTQANPILDYVDTDNGVKPCGVENRPPRSG